LQRCALRNVSVMMTQEVAELFGVTRLSEYDISHLSTTWCYSSSCAETPK
jgi:hypothetical protein